MNILASTKLGTTPERKREFVALIVEHAKLNSEEPVENEDVKRFIVCAEKALPHFSVKIVLCLKRDITILTWFQMNV